MATIGIDIGANFSVMATVGRGTVDIVRNDISERLTPSLVGFSDNERLLGDPAFTSFKSNFRNTCRNMKMILGRLHDSTITEEQQFCYAPLVPAAEGGLVGYKVTNHGEECIINGTSAMAAMLGGLKDVAERSLKQPVVEAVIGVPSWYSDRQCQAMLDAANIAGIPCLRVMSEHAATALDYGIYRASSFHQSEPHRVVFVNVGYANSTVSIVDFVQNELRVVHVESDSHLGGRNMDRVMAEHMAIGISKKLGFNLLEKPKPRMKVEEACVKAKKVLSANTDTAISLESVYEDEDLNAIITREEFEEGCAYLKERLNKLLKNAFQKNGGAKVHSIELVGGGTRVPWVQDAILEATQDALGMGDEENPVCLSRTLNQDECVAKGCALQAAMLSPRFKVRDFNVVDIVVHPLAISWDPHALAREMKVEGAVGDAEMSTGDDAAKDSNDNSKLLVSRGTPYPTNKWVTFEPCNTFAVKLTYADPATLPPTVPEVLGDFRVNLTSVPKAGAKIKLRLNVDLNRKSAVHAHLSEREEVVKVVKEKNPATPTSVGCASPTADAGIEQPQSPAAEALTTDAAADVSPKTTVEIVKKKTALPVTFDERPGWLTDAAMKELKEKELAMMNEDRQHVERKEKLNDLESYVYNMRDKAQSGPLADYFEASVKAKFIEKLNEVESWIYDAGENAQKSELVAKLDELKVTGDRALNLKKERDSREEAVARFLDDCREIRMTASSGDEKFSHIEDSEKHGIIARANELEKWINEQVAVQSSMPLFQEPVLSTGAIVNQTQEFAAKAREVLLKPKPAPSADPSPVAKDATPPSPQAAATESEEQPTGA